VGTVAEALSAAASLTRAGRYFEAHEFLEWVWKAPEVPEAERDFWKGVTQVVVGCVHVQRGNDAGARSLLERGLGHLERYPGRHELIDAERLMTDAHALLGALRGHAARPRQVALPVLRLLR
jgi:predicted metal-dependent hydrolase